MGRSARYPPARTRRARINNLLCRRKPDIYRISHSGEKHLLTGLRLGNFKAFGETQNIPIKPLTLIFGANSAGKSSIIHGLLLAHHANETGELNVYKTNNLGDAVDLGGFQQYVHRHDLTRKVQWGGKVNTDALYFESTTADAIFEHLTGASLDTLKVTDGRFLDCLRMVKEFDFDIVFDASSRHPLETYTVRADGKILLQLSHEGEGLVPRNVNYKHPFCKALWNVLAKMESDAEGPFSSRQEIETYDKFFQQPAQNFTEQQVFKSVRLRTFSETEGKATKIDWRYWDDVISKYVWNRCYSGNFIPKHQSDETRNERKTIDATNYCLRNLSYDDDTRIEVINLRDSLLNQSRLEAFVGDLVLVLAMILENNIDGVTHIGPVRSYPERFNASVQQNFNPYTCNQLQGYYFSGLLAQRLNSVNTWLGSSRMNTPYEIRIRRYASEDGNSSTISELVLHDKRFDTTLRFEDVGAGISQVLPVLTAVYSYVSHIIAIEQPELHLHPALQAELGDVFIEAALGEDQNTLLLETHSEHLILRIMRRMRDTVRDTLPEGMPPVRPEDVAILYVDRKDDDSTSVVSVLELDEEGQLLDPWPGGFFEEGFNERFA